jgi:hypothetical protein
MKKTPNTNGFKSMERNQYIDILIPHSHHKIGCPNKTNKQRNLRKN